MIEAADVGGTTATAPRPRLRPPTWVAPRPRHHGHGRTGQPDLVEDAVCRYRIGEARRFIADMGARTEGEQHGRWLLAALVDYIERAQESELDVDEHWAALDFFRAGMDAREEG